MKTLKICLLLGIGFWLLSMVCDRVIPFLSQWITVFSESAINSIKHEDDELKAENVRWIGQDVEGDVVNRSDHAYNYIQVEINGYDTDNNLIANAMDNANNFAAGECWHFRAHFWNSGVRRIKIIRVFAH